MRYSPYSGSFHAYMGKSESQEEMDREFAASLVDHSSPVPQNVTAVYRMPSAGEKILSEVSPRLRLNSKLSWTSFCLILSLEVH